MQYTILAVDDNPINLELIEKSLVDSSYLIIRALSGDEALRLATEKRPDLILLDVSMPDPDGFEVCRRLQSEEATRYIPVIFLSAKNEAQSKARGLALGAADYLTKPFNALELNARIRTHLAQRKRNVDILEKIRRMQDTMFKKENHAPERSLDGDHTGVFDAFPDEQFIELRENALIAAAATGQGRRTVNMLIPFYPNEQQLGYLSFRGVKNDLPTKVVRYMIESYLNGYLKGNRRKGLSPEQLVHLFENLLEQFDPDRYKVGFTFSLALIDLKESYLSLFAVHQPMPYVMGADGHPVQISGAEIPLHERYAEFVNTVQTKLTRGTLLLIINPLPQKSWLELNTPLLNDIEWNDEAGVKSNLNLLMEGMDGKKQDQLIGVVYLN